MQQLPLLKYGVSLVGDLWKRPVLLFSALPNPKLQSSVLRKEVLVNVGSSDKWRMEEKSSFPCAETAKQIISQQGCLNLISRTVATVALPIKLAMLDNSINHTWREVGQRRFTQSQTFMVVFKSSPTQE